MPVTYHITSHSRDIGFQLLPKEEHPKLCRKTKEAIGDILKRFRILSERLNEGIVGINPALGGHHSDQHLGHLAPTCQVGSHMWRAKKYNSIRGNLNRAQFRVMRDVAGG